MTFRFGPERRIRLRKHRYEFRRPGFESERIGEPVIRGPDRLVGFFLLQSQILQLQLIACDVTEQHDALVETRVHVVEHLAGERHMFVEDALLVVETMQVDEPSEHQEPHLLTALLQIEFRHACVQFGHSDSARNRPSAVYHLHGLQREVVMGVRIAYTHASREIAVRHISVTEITDGKSRVEHRQTTAACHLFPCPGFVHA